MCPAGPLRCQKSAAAESKGGLRGAQARTPKTRADAAAAAASDAKYLLYAATALLAAAASSDAKYLLDAAAALLAAAAYRAMYNPINY